MKTSKSYRSDLWQLSKNFTFPSKCNYTDKVIKPNIVAHIFEANRVLLSITRWLGGWKCVTTAKKASKSVSYNKTNHPARQHPLPLSLRVLENIYAGWTPKVAWSLSLHMHGRKENKLKFIMISVIYFSIIIMFEMHYPIIKFYLG